MPFPAAVERWRSVVAKHLPPELVDKMLHVIQFESGGNPGAIGDNGVAIGLTQIQDNTRFKGRPSKAQLLDPEFNIAYAASELGAANGNFSAWGEGVTYQGKKFGALGNHPYPSGSGVHSSRVAQTLPFTGERPAAQNLPFTGDRPQVVNYMEEEVDEFGFPITSGGGTSAANVPEPPADGSTPPGAIKLPGGGYMILVPEVGDYAIFMPKTDSLTGASTVEFAGWRDADDPASAKEPKGAFSEAELIGAGGKKRSPGVIEINGTQYRKQPDGTYSIASVTDPKEQPKRTLDLSSVLGNVSTSTTDPHGKVKTTKGYNALFEDAQVDVPEYEIDQNGVSTRPVIFDQPGGEMSIGNQAAEFRGGDTGVGFDTSEIMRQYGRQIPVDPIARGTAAASLYSKQNELFNAGLDPKAARDVMTATNDPNYDPGNPFTGTGTSLPKPPIGRQPHGETFFAQRKPRYQAEGGTNMAGLPMDDWDPYASFGKTGFNFNLPNMGANNTQWQNPAVTLPNDYGDPTPEMPGQSNSDIFTGNNTWDARQNNPQYPALRRLGTADLRGSGVTLEGDLIQGEKVLRTAGINNPNSFGKPAPGSGGLPELEEYMLNPQAYPDIENVIDYYRKAAAQDKLMYTGPQPDSRRSSFDQAARPVMQSQGGTNMAGGPPMDAQGIRNGFASSGEIGLVELDGGGPLTQQLLKMGVLRAVTGEGPDGIGGATAPEKITVTPMNQPPSVQEIPNPMMGAKAPSADPFRVLARTRK